MLVVEVVQTMHSVGVHVYVNVCGIVCMQMCVCVCVTGLPMTC